MNERLLTLKEAAETLRISVCTLRRWIKEGEVPFVKLTGTTIRIQSQALQAFISRSVTKKAG